MARTTSTQARPPRFLSFEHLKRWLREHPRGQSILHEVTVAQPTTRAPVLVVVGTYMGYCRPHTLVRCYAGKAVQLKLIQTQHVGHWDDEPLADEYADELARKWYPGRALLDEYGCLPNRPRIEHMVKMRTADDKLRTQFQTWLLEILTERVIPAEYVEELREYPELLALGQ